MFSDELKSLLIKVITSWQVIVVTIVLVIYVFLVNYVARLYHRKRPIPMPKPGKKKEASVNDPLVKAPPPAPEPASGDDLGLEEKVE
jgi:hypothetical protein